MVMETLCICLDVLQGEKNMYFGFLLPSVTISVTMLIQKYDNLSRKHLIYCKSLVILLKNCVKKRIQTFLEDPFLLSAADSHPYFITVWINC